MSEAAGIRSVVLGPLLFAGYAVLAVAATARSLVQILSRFDAAPLPYTLSAASATVYLRPGRSLPARRADRSANRRGRVQHRTHRRSGRRDLERCGPDPIPRSDGLVGLRARMRLQAVGAAGGRVVVDGADDPAG